MRSFSHQESWWLLRQALQAACASQARIHTLVLGVYWSLHVESAHFTDNQCAQLEDDLAELNEIASGVQRERKKRTKSRSEGYNLITGESLIFDE